MIVIFDYRIRIVSNQDSNPDPYVTVFAGFLMTWYRVLTIYNNYFDFIPDYPVKFHTANTTQSQYR
jgi:hypothetical protein